MIENGTEKIKTEISDNVFDIRVKHTTQRHPVIYGSTPTQQTMMKIISEHMVVNYLT